MSCITAPSSCAHSRYCLVFARPRNCSYAVVNICRRFKAVIDSVRFRLVPSSRLMSAVISVIACSVSKARCRTPLIFCRRAASSVFAACMRATLSVSKEVCVATRPAMSRSRPFWCLWRWSYTAGAEDRVEGCEKMVLRWSIGS